LVQPEKETFLPQLPHPQSIRANNKKESRIK